MLQQAWLQRGPLACLLWPLSMLYRLLVAARRQFYRLGILQTQRVGVPVIVVGNVVAGGAGKTPAVIALAQHLQACGWRPGIVSRGYGRAGHECMAVQPDSSPQDVGDEPLLLRRATGLPVVVAAHRVEAARALLEDHPQVNLLLADDGLQHLALFRDIEVLLFDDRGVGNGWLLPAGPLREPWPRPANLVLRTGGPRAPGDFKAQRQLADHAIRADGRRIELAELRGRKLCALAGIARPESFFDMLRAKGLDLAHTMALSDHADFGTQAPALPQGCTVLCTEKDAVKLWRMQPEVLAVPLLFTPEAAFFHALDQLLSKNGYETS